MAHFYGVVKGSARTRETRCGSKNSGIFTHISTWNKGIAVNCIYDERLNKNIFKVYTTGGSNKPHETELIAEIEEVLQPKSKKRIKKIKTVEGWFNYQLG